MRDTPAQLGTRYPAEDLRRYSFHTGAPLRPLGRDEPCPVLFRDLGPVALGRYLRGTLPRLAGPLTPLLYMRTVDYVEPYTDHEDIGRLVFLRPLALQPWFSGVPHVYVARASRPVEGAAVAWCPGSVPLREVEALARDMTGAGELREALGGGRYDEQVAHATHALDALVATLEATERAAQPLRSALQSGESDRRRRARDELSRLGLSEDDLCAAWHHLPRERRAFIQDALARLEPRALEGGR